MTSTQGGGNRSYNIADLHPNTLDVVEAIWHPSHQRYRILGASMSGLASVLFAESPFLSMVGNKKLDSEVYEVHDCPIMRGGRVTPAKQAEKRIGLWGNPVPTHLVNMDALIQREDFEVKSESLPQSSSKVEKFNITEFEAGRFLHPIIRKPDFQRETASWDPDKVADLIRSFLDGDLIPSIIVWRSPDTGNIFVIDGAHRLGALIAWVHNDYGDGDISRKFYENRIPNEQAVAADKTRSIINKTIGTYKEMIFAVSNQQNSDAEKVRRAKNLVAYGIPVQWIDGDAKKAEISFFKINQKAAPIDVTELKLLKARNLPNALAARAIIRAGTGHKYWGKFNDEARAEIVRLSKDINDYLFIPSLATPIKTLNIPIAGRVYSAQALPLLYDLVNISNGVRFDRKKKGADIVDSSPTIDEDGTQTINFLRNTRKLVARISSPQASSLGLHPAVYFYSANGRHQPTSLLAVTSLIIKLEKENGFIAFIKNRRQFEDFLLKYKDFINQIVVKSGSGLKGYGNVEMLLSFVLGHIGEGKSEKEILDALHDDPKFGFLKITTEEPGRKQKDFNTDTKSAAFIKSALENPLRCRICSCLIHQNAITFDHVDGKKDGGLGTVDNAQLAHPYCNGTFKELGHTVAVGTLSYGE